MIKVGLGYDIHKLKKGRRLILGGVQIPFPKGLLGHSDADVLIHSIIDALLGAIGEGDIGEHFPDDDKRYKDISSEKLLKEVAKRIIRKKATIVNIDTVIICEKPRILEYKQEMRENICRILNINKDQINIKAKTQEGLEKQEAISSWAIVNVKMR